MAERLPLVAKGAGDGEEEEEGEADEQVGLATGDRDDSRSLRFYVELFVVVTLFMTLGPALILVNKTILTDMHFPYPILVSAVGQAAAWLMTLVVYRITCSMELTMAHKVTWRFYLVNMGTIGAGTACALALGQAVYFYLTVSFVQILKSIMPVITSVLLVAFRIEMLSSAVWFCVMMISLGAAMASYGELKFNAYGVMLMLASSTCEGLRIVLTQKLLNNMQFPAFENLYYSSPIATLWMAGASLVLEVPGMVADEYGPPLPEGVPRPFTAMADCAEMLLLCAVLGVAVNLASMLVIKYTSSLSLKLLGTARNACLVLYAIAVNGEQTTELQLTGYAICCIFFAAYVVCKSRPAWLGFDS